MSKIDKLNITGIRSFNTQRGETIQFYTPLTLIVGVNGSGKTTIIESLKYVTTGELPPGAKKGGAFIHDPKLLGEREVMAQAKLQFKSIHGYRMVVTRSLQLTITRTSRSQKALEGSLLMEKHGEKHVVSSRVAELDEIMPQHLGVSPAVLENVIFCHQEESLWPMSEPLSLKKKFDEIFEAQKYIKAIDNIKGIRKAHNEKLGQYKILEQHAKEDRDRAEAARKKSVKLSDEIEGLRTRCKELDKLMEDAREAAHKAWKQSESYAEILGALTGKRIEADNREKSIDDIRQHLVEVEETDEWLEHTLEQFESTLAQYEDEKETKGERWHEWKHEIEELQEQKSEKLTERGKLEQDRDEYERQLENRRAVIKDAAMRHSIRGYDDLTDDKLIESFLHKIRKMSKDQNTALERAHSSAEEEKQEAKSNVNRLNARKDALEEGRLTAKDQITQYDRQIQEFQRQVSGIQADEGSKAVIESRIENVTTALNRAQEMARNANWETKLAGAKQKLRDYEDERAKLDSDLMQCMKRANEVAELAHLKRERKEKQRSLQTLLDTHRERIEKLIGSDWNAGTVEATLQRVIDEASREVKAAERERDNITRDIEQINFKQKTARDDILAKKKSAAKHIKSVQDTIGAEIAEYDEVLKEAESQLDEARDQSKGLGGLADYFKNALDAAENNHVCRLCQRKYRSETDTHFITFKKRLESLMKKAAIDAEVVDFEAAEARYKQVSGVNMQYATWKKLAEEEIPGLEKELERLSQQRDLLLKKADKHDKTVEQRQSAFNDLETITRTVSSMARHESEIASLHAKVEELSVKQSQQGAVKTPEDLQEEISTVTEHIQTIKKTTAQITLEKEASESQNNQAKIQLLELKNELSTANSQLEKKANLALRVDEIKALVQKQREAMDKTYKDIEQIEPQILTAKAKLEDISTRWKTKLTDLTTESTKLSETVRDLNFSNDQIRSYIDRGGSNRLSSIKREIEAIEQDREKAEKAQTQLTVEISRIEAQLRDSQATKRQYSDNLRFRQQTRALEQLRHEISDLASQNAEVDRDRFEEESKRNTNQFHKHSAAREGLLGQMKTKDVQLKELIDDYNTDYQDAPKRYKEAHIKVETTKAAIEDLARYGGALDKAIMKFHTLKMAQINDIIYDLWRQTYQGTDVDSIMIRSDPEQESNSKSTSAASATRRQYNYRVTMVKQGVEMDMRGRCSAGQRVLACIIIRLALAEVFSANCGIIALDEPTTNLDRDNIQALARSLHDIIKTRRQQSNFQLLVITHDEDFLRHMECGDFTDYYYRISRDSVGDSIIERQDILEVDR